MAEETRIESYAFGGQFLPRSVLEGKGYDMESIIPKLPKSDIEDNPVLGMTYRIAIKSKTFGHSLSSTRRTTGTRTKAIEGPMASQSARHDSVRWMTHTLHSQELQCSYTVGVALSTVPLR